VVSNSVAGVASRRQVPQAMEFNHDLHAITYCLANLLERCNCCLHLLGSDVETASFLRCRIKWPDFHGGDALFEEALG
jgi:hypothetical protein